MTAEKAIQTLEGLLGEYKKNVPEHLKKVEQAIGALKEYITFAEGRMASSARRTASPMIVFHGLKDIWEGTKKNKEMFVKIVRKDLNDLIRTYTEARVEEALDEATGGVVTISMVKGTGMKALSSLLREMAAAVSPDKLKGFVTDIEEDTVENKNFRKVLYTGKNSQLVLMSLKHGEDIGEEIHEDTDQFFRVEKGNGTVVINGVKKPIKDGSAIVIPQGARHNVVNDGAEDQPMSLYTVYSPPHHEDGTIHKTKEEAVVDKEHFDGKTTE